MAEAIDENVATVLAGWRADPPPRVEPLVAVDRLEALLDAQVQSRHLDLAARLLQAVGEVFYTIGSAGHEANAAVAMALRPTDPALLHYRSGGFYAARAAQVPGTSPVDDVLRGAMASTDDPISGGRHKVFGNRALSIIPQTSTIASHLPRAVGLAWGIGRGLPEPSWPSDSVVVASLGDASANHSTAVGAFNAAGYLAHQGVPLPLLLVCEDNGIGISTRTPQGWTERSLTRLPGIRYVAADGTRPDELLATCAQLAADVRETRRPAVLHLATRRFMGHAGSDAEIAYRSRAEIAADHAHDPVLATMRALVAAGARTPDELLERYEATRAHVMERAEALLPVSRLRSAFEVVRPVVATRPDAVARSARATAPDRSLVHRAGRLPEDAGPLTLAQTLNAALHDALGTYPQAVVLGEDVARKGGVYGVTRGLRRQFGASRVVDTLLDEQTVLGSALGLALGGHLPIPEIQYLAYLHNAEDQLRGEAATLSFFSDGRYTNPMVVRIAGLAYQKGFGGHFHNDNSLAVLRDVPGLAVAVPSHPSTAAGLLRHSLALAREEGRPVAFVEPIALYHRRDLVDGDGAWLASYAPPDQWDDVGAPGTVSTWGDGGDVLLVTFGNGVALSRQAIERLADDGVRATVVDLQWITPLPVAALLDLAHRFSHVLVVDETRRSGGVSESVLTAFVDAGLEARMARVTSEDSFVPLGPAAAEVLLSVQDVVDATRKLLA